MEAFNVSGFELFARKWGLLAAGDAQDSNAMTISWGGVGTLWGKPMVTVYVMPCRHTYQYMEKNDYFTVSFYPEAYKEDLGVMGTLSGRDGDKVAKTSLTLRPLEHGVTFEQAEVTLVCRKTYWQDLDKANMPQYAIDHHYRTEAPHRMYIGEVVEIIRK